MNKDKNFKRIKFRDNGITNTLTPYGEINLFLKTIIDWGKKNNEIEGIALVGHMLVVRQEKILILTLSY